ncbi:DNA-processing protein DprA [Cardinium endosymbiont of Tipula unca]|uniref:DNA-processing protein DprA n=1 Tax=Cardinium endosymbiont of Tipula unca TaxID=3066216 RepID=UPI0030D39A6C
MATLTQKEKHYRLALSLVPGIGCAWLRKLLTHFGSAQAVFEASSTKRGVIPIKVAEAIHANSNIDRVKKIIETHEAHNIELITTEEAAYPQRLLELPDRPSILYYKGAKVLNKQKIVCIVGTRQLSSYGRESITKFMEQLVPYQPLVVSGLAYGADIWTHQQALEQGLDTVAVLPSSLDEIYPSAHKKTAMQMCELGGGILTEYPIGSGLGAYSFVARNRILAGVADVTIVIEAKEKSGALITAYYANSYHREVFALPGSIYTATSAGCHQLIKRNQAHLITNVSDLAYLMNWEISPKNETQQKEYTTYKLTASEQMVLEQIRKKTVPIAVDNLTCTTGLPPGELQAALLSLELQGLVSTLPGKRFMLASTYSKK